MRYVAALAAALASTSLHAQAPDLAAAFGARVGVEGASLSPDGKRIALLAAGPGQQDVLYVIDVAEGATPRRVMAASGNPEHLYNCRWAGNERLTCNLWQQAKLNGVFYTMTTVIGVGADGSNIKVLSKRRGEDRLYFDGRGGDVIDWLPGDDGAVLMSRSYVPESDVGSLIEKRTEGLGVDRIDTRTGAAKKVEQPRRNVVEYITDGRGNVRIRGDAVPDAVGYATGKIKYFWRAVGGQWQDLGVYDGLTKSGFNPYYVDPRLNVAYGFEKRDGRLALVSVGLTPDLPRQVLVSDARVDVDGIVTIGRERRVVGGSFATEDRTNVYFDPSVKTLSGALAKALGGDRSVWITDASADENRLLVWAGSDTDPGQYYLFDKAAKKLSPVVPERPQLAGVKLAEVKPIEYAAADGTKIPAYLTLPVGSNGKDLPAIVMPHGGPEARDYWGFDWLAQYFAARGFAVIQPNFRGSAGYGEAWLMQNGFKSWRTSVGDVVDAGKYLVAQGIANRDKLTILGWSYGGYAALQANVLAPDLFKAVVAIAPVTDLPGLVAARRDYTSYYLNKDYIGSGPHLQQGSPAQNVAAFKAPVLMFHGTMDVNVPVEQSRLMNDKLRDGGKRTELVIFEGLTHNLDESAARTRMLQQAGDFLLAAGK